MAGHLARAVLLVALAAGSASAADPFERARDAYYRGDYAKAVEGYREAAEQGNVEAQYFIGLSYAKGQGV
ncbi:MAG: sporulation protein, partial [Deltaproteobacteria bacterium]|nr:sporulation protein [Deltaproteobacteria bacterium]